MLDDLPEQVISQEPPITGVTAPDVTDRLPAREIKHTAPVAVVAAHGGAGASSLSRVDPELFVDCGTAWPDTTHRQACLVVARSSAHGLYALQTALQQWASSQTPDVELVGAVVIADAPGDRKSTRLNSSHVSISYAVFGLKK